MAERAISILKNVGNPNKARIIAHLAKHRGETAEDLGKHLGYPLPTVYKYLRELEAARIVQSEAKGKLRIYHPAEFELVISPGKLMEMLEEQTFMNSYRTRLGEEGIERLRGVAEKIKTGRMTYRQAASTLGITYYELVSLLDEMGGADE